MSTYTLRLNSDFDSAFDRQLLPMFPSVAHVGLRQNQHKHLVELRKVANVLDRIGTPCPLRYLDVGCGAGVNLILAKLLWGKNVEALGLDRFDEFEEKYHREVGSTTEVISRMNAVDVSVQVLNIITDDFKVINCQQDVITCFDVIEHFTFSPIPFLKKLYSQVMAGGALIIGTPNQVHLRNRLRAFQGKNTWEDFDYFINSDVFYGHVREFTPKELITLSKLISKTVELDFSTYPLIYMMKETDSSLLRLFYKVGVAVLKRFPTLNYYMMSTMTK